MLFALRGCAITLVGTVHHSRKWIRQCTFSMGIELSSVLVIIMIMILMEQDSKVDNIKDSLAMNITMLSSLLSQPRTETAVLSGINVFESCAILIESNCTILPSFFPGSRSLPCTTPGVLLNLVRSDYKLLVIVLIKLLLILLLSRLINSLWIRDVFVQVKSVMLTIHW